MTAQLCRLDIYGKLTYADPEKNSEGSEGVQSLTRWRFAGGPMMAQH